MFSSVKARRIFIQGAFVVSVIALIVSIVVVGQHNIAAQGIATGFGFLDRTTGWPVSFSLIDVSARSTYAWVLYAGILNTLLVGFLTLFFATVLGVLLALMRVSDNGPLRFVGTGYIEIFRNVPVILQVFFWYAILTHVPGPREAISLFELFFFSNRGLVFPIPNYSVIDTFLLLGLFILLSVGNYSTRNLLPLGQRILLFITIFSLIAFLLLFIDRSVDEPMFSIPALRGLRFKGGMTVKPEFLALLVGLVLFGASYIGEIVRGGLLSVDNGKLEAGTALGLSVWQINSFIRVPLAFRAMLPSLTNQYVWLMKATTLGIAIGYPDYFAIISTSINQSGQTMELLGLLMLGFLIINYSISFCMNLINDRIKLKGRN